MSDKSKLTRIIAEYGFDNQVNQTIEECSELIKALLKFRRNRDDYASLEYLKRDIIDEIADVSIMLDQLKIIFECDADVEKRVDFKINRQLERIKTRGF